MGTALTDLLQDEVELHRVTNAITAAIVRSFETHPMRKIVETEVQRRFDICVKWFRRMKAVPFTTRRALNEIPIALAAELDQRTYEIPTSSLWSPSGERL